MAGQSHEGSGLHGEHREHAGHQVEDQAAQQGKQQRLDERERLAALRSGKRRWRHESGIELGRHVESLLDLAVAGLLRQHQRAGELGGKGRLGVTALQRNANTVGADPGALLGHAGDRAPLGREEIDLPDGVGLQAPGLDDQRRIARLGDAVARGPRARHRHALARLVEDRARRGRRRCAGRRHRQGELELAVLGDADVFAHQPVGFGGEFQRADAEIGGRRDANQQHGLVLKTVVDDAADIEAMRRRPDDRVGLHAGRQGPFDLGRQAGFARVLPVGMPLRPDGLAQADPERLARLHRRHVGQKLGADIVGLHDRLAEGRASGEQHQEKGKQTLHASLVSDPQARLLQGNPDQRAVIFCPAANSSLRSWRHWGNHVAAR